MSASCQKARYAAQQNCPLFDYFVGAREHGRRNFEAERLAGFEVGASGTGISEGLGCSRSLAPRFFHECLGLPGSGDDQFAWVEETDLSEHTGLIPIDMLVGDLVPFKFHHDNMWHRYSPPGRWNTRKHVINGAVVREIQDELIHHLVPGRFAGQPGCADPRGATEADGAPRP